MQRHAMESRFTRLRDLGADLAAGVQRVVGYARGLRTERDGLSRWAATRMGAAAAVDEALLTSFQIVRSPPSTDHFAERLDDARSLVETLMRDESIFDPQLLHPRPPAATFAGEERRVGHVRFRHATFPSPYHPDPALPGAQRFSEQFDNQLAHAWILAHDHPAPWVVCVHGAGMGDPVADILAFRAGALHRAGFNVAIPVLPHHGPRGAGRMSVAFPTDDPSANFHGASQAIADVRAVLVGIEALGEPAMLFGISLGGYVAGAVAALEPDLRGVVVGVPVADLSVLLRRHAPERFRRHPLFEAMHETARQLEACTSPLVLPVPATPVRRVWAGRADRLAQPDQVQRIVARWSTEQPYWYAGGHMGFLGLPRVQRYVRDAIVDAGLGERRHGRLHAVALGA